MSFSKQAKDAIDGWKAKAWRMEQERDAAVDRLMERTAERDRVRATAVALEQDGAMAHKALMILAEAVLNEVNPNAAVYSKALAVKQIGGTA